LFTGRLPSSFAQKLSGGVSKLAATLRGSPISGNHHDDREAHEDREDIPIALLRELLRKYVSHRTAVQEPSIAENAETAE
jgi:hypothetical protein